MSTYRLDSASLLVKIAREVQRQAQCCKPYVTKAQLRPTLRPASLLSLLEEDSLFL